jgi:hypothetical protein
LALTPASEPVQTLPRLRTAGTSRQRGFNYAIGRCFHRSRVQ